MNEGDLVIVFSQFGEVVDCRLARDRTTGKSKGFAWLAYEDQRSTILAVDNLNGIELCERTILVDHVKQYKIPKEFMFLSDSDSEKKGKNDEKGDKEIEKDESDFEGSSAERKREAKAKEKFERKLYKPTGPDGRGWGDFRQVTNEEVIILEELEKIAAREARRRE